MAEQGIQSLKAATADLLEHRLGCVLYLMRFLDVMRGTLIAAPTRLLPVTKMPLLQQQQQQQKRCGLFAMTQYARMPHAVSGVSYRTVKTAAAGVKFGATYHAAPKMEVPTHKATPVTAQK